MGSTPSKNNYELIPFMKTLNELISAQAYLVATASYIFFVVMTIGSLVFISAVEAVTSGYWILLICYTIILYYAISGSKLGLKKD